MEIIIHGDPDMPPPPFTPPPPCADTSLVASVGDGDDVSGDDEGVVTVTTSRSMIPELGYCYQNLHNCIGGTPVMYHRFACELCFVHIGIALFSYVQCAPIETESLVRLLNPVVPASPYTSFVRPQYLLLRCHW